MAAHARSRPSGPLLLHLEAALIAAGRPCAPAVCARFAAGAGVVAALIAVLVLAVAGAPWPSVAVGGVVGAVVAGGALPALWLRRRIRRRRAEIARSLPDAADLLTVCVEAGLDINASFARVARELPGALQDEVQIMLHEISLGRSRHEALRDVGRRTGVADLDGMLAAVMQSEETGTALGAMLRAQSRHIRNAHRLQAEERARLIPAKMTFPIVFLIVPTLFILLLGPIAFEIARVFS